MTATAPAGSRNEKLSTLSHNMVRDLAWTMQSPSLMVSTDQGSGVQFVSDEYCQTNYSQSLQWLQQQDNNPESLVAHLEKRKSRRLGYYFEDLVAFWLENRIADGGVEAHIKVSSDNRDVGEFDFLFPANNSTWHWETAVKFYLYLPGNEEEENWYGPNARDTLYKKLVRLSQHQVRLGQLPEAQKLMSARGIKYLQAQIFLKGYLFYPPRIDLSKIDRQVAGLEISPAHLKGWWLPINCIDPESLREISDRDLRWRVLPRLEWLAGRIYKKSQAEDSLLKAEGSLLTPSQMVKCLRKDFEKSDESRLLAGYYINENGQWQEGSRGFVVGQHWPGKAG